MAYNPRYKEVVGSSYPASKSVVKSPAKAPEKVFVPGTKKTKGSKKGTKKAKK